MPIQCQFQKDINCRISLIIVKMGAWIHKASNKLKISVQADKHTWEADGGS